MRQRRPGSSTRTGGRARPDRSRPRRSATCRGASVTRSPADEPLGRLAGLARQADVDLGDLGAGPLAGVGQAEPTRGSTGRPVDLRADLQLPVVERGVREPVAEREQRLDPLGVVPAVADLQALAVVDLADLGRCPGGRGRAAVGEDARVLRGEPAVGRSASRAGNVCVSLPRRVDVARRAGRRPPGPSARRRTRPRARP